jgi:hypothetical protein
VYRPPLAPSSPSAAAVSHPPRHAATDQRTNAPTSARGVEVAAFPRSAEALVDALVVLDHFTNAKRRAYWPEPPRHVTAKMWETISSVAGDAAQREAASLSFSQLVHALAASKRLFISASYGFAEESAAIADAADHSTAAAAGTRPSVNAERTESAAATTTMTPKARATARHVRRAYRFAQRDVARGAGALLDMIAAQQASLGKLVNQFHFAEVVDAMHVMQLAAEHTAARDALRACFLERAQARSSGGGGAAGAPAWTFSREARERIELVLGLAPASRV